MKMAIPIFENRISPRFDFSPEIWIIEVKRGEVVSQGKFSTGNLNLPQRLEQIASNGVDKKSSAAELMVFVRINLEAETSMLSRKSSVKPRASLIFS